MQGAYYLVGRARNEKGVRDIDGPFADYASAQHATLGWVEKSYIDVKPVARVRQRPSYKGASKKR